MYPYEKFAYVFLQYFIHVEALYKAQKENERFQLIVCFEFFLKKGRKTKKLCLQT